MIIGSMASPVNKADRMIQIKFTLYFENEVLRKRPYLTKDMCAKIIEAPLKVERQEDNRFRFWGKVGELEDRIVRVVTLEDRATIHNAFLDRRVKL